MEVDHNHGIIQGLLKCPRTCTKAQCACTEIFFFLNKMSCFRNIKTPNHKMILAYYD